MLGWLMIISCIIIMYKAAEMERRNGLVWGGYTFLCCLGIVQVLPSLVLINIFLGLIVSFGTMFVANILRDQKRSG